MVFLKGIGRTGVASKGLALSPLPDYLSLQLPCRLSWRNWFGT